MATFGLALLLFFAAVGPACLLAATEAMGMSTGSMPMTPSECGGEEENGPTAACPHADPVEVVADSGRTVSLPLDVIFSTYEPVVMSVAHGPVASPVECEPSPPPSHLTPLRV